MDSQNIHSIISQLKSITESIYKIARGVNNHWSVWIAPISSFITALLLGSIAIFQDKIKYYFYKPKFDVKIVNYHISRGRIKDSDSYYNFLFKIENVGKSSMEDVEVLVQEIWESNKKNKKEINFIPLKLKWKNYGNNLTMSKIPSFVYEYSDFGYVDSPIQTKPLLIKFQIDNSEIVLPQGSYEIKIRFSANNIEPEEIIYDMTIKNKWDKNNIEKTISIKQKNKNI